MLHQAAAEDQEDGPLDGVAISWTSDLDGALGTGSPLAINASDLSQGEHVMTVVVTDTSGQTATDSVAITIERIAVNDATLRQRLERFADDLSSAGDPTLLAAEELLRPVLSDDYWESSMVLTSQLGEEVFRATRQAGKLLE